MTGRGVIVMAVYRPDRMLLSRQIRSIQDQHEADWTCLVGIDGKDTATTGFVRALVTNDPRFEVLEYEQNLGHYRHFERLLQAVPETAPWFALSDQDDVWHPEKLAVLVPELRRSTVMAALGQANVTTASGDVVGRTSRQVGDLAELLVKNQVTGCFLVAARGLLSTALPFPDDGPSARHDHWLGVIARATGEVVVRPETLQDYVQHSGNAIGERDPSRPSFAGAVTARPWRALERLSRDQWGWRVSMARALLARVELTSNESETLHAVARGRLSLVLCKVLLGLVHGRGIRADVALGAAAGAAWWPLAGRRGTDVWDRRSLG